MSIWAFATWAAIGVLVAGSVAVFLWFLADVRSVLGGKAQSGDEP